MKVLLINDEQALLNTFSQALTQAGFTVITALTGNEGLTKAKNEIPDVIFLGEIMPDSNGNDILKALKTDPATSSIPVAILSNFRQEELVQEAMNLGAVDYILKYQIEAPDLVNKVNLILKEHGSIPPVQQEQPVTVIPQEIQTPQEEVPNA